MCIQYIFAILTYITEFSSFLLIVPKFDLFNVCTHCWYFVGMCVCVRVCVLCVCVCVCEGTGAMTYFLAHFCFKRMIYRRSNSNLIMCFP